MSGQFALHFFQTGGHLRQEVGATLHALAWTKRHTRHQMLVEELDHLLPLIRRDSVVVDVGAHAGSWTVPLARRVGRGGLVISYEALPHYGKALQRCLRFLRLRNAVVRTVAVGEKDGEVVLRWRSEKGAVLSGRTHLEASSSRGIDGTVAVSMTSLDDDLRAQGIELNRVAFIKIDVEGAELRVLRGARDLLDVAHPAVYLEAEAQWTERFGYVVSDIFDEMGGRGYRPHVIGRSGIEATTLDEFLADNVRNNVLFLADSTG